MIKIQSCAAVVLFSLVWSCGEAPFAMSGENDDAGAGETGDAGDAAVSEASAKDSELPPMVHIHIRATAAAFPHADSLSSQTPIDQGIGILALELRRDAQDPEPLIVFDQGNAFVQAGLNHGDDTLVASVPASSLRAGVYEHARVRVSHVSYRVRGTMHAYGSVVAGEFDNVQVLTSGVSIGGEPRDSGWYRFSFEVGGQSYGTREGAGGPLPEGLASGGIGLEVVGGQAAYAFATHVVVAPDVAFDTNMVFEVNMHESFRWQDLAEPAYEPGTFDTTPLSFEPVKRFGANSFSVLAE